MSPRTVARTIVAAVMLLGAGTSLAATQAWVTRPIKRLQMVGYATFQIVLQPADVPECQSNQLVGGKTIDYFTVNSQSAGGLPMLAMFHEMALAAFVKDYPVTLGYDSDSPGCLVNQIHLSKP